MLDQRSVIATSENEASPIDYHEKINYSLPQKISEEKRKSRKLSGQIDCL